jgi:hypothetical protein
MMIFDLVVLGYGVIAWRSFRRAAPSEGNSKRKGAGSTVFHVWLLVWLLTDANGLRIWVSGQSWLVQFGIGAAANVICVLVTALLVPVAGKLATLLASGVSSDDQHSITTVTWSLARLLLLPSRPEAPSRHVAFHDASTTPPGVRPAIVTLVHGTWARNAAWTQDGSRLRAAIAETLGPNTDFRQFLWNGTNSYTARMDAAEALQRDLLASIAAHPGAPHFIVAHSHGGNVSLYALRNPKLAKSVRGLVLMATPVFLRRPRRLEPMVTVVSYVVSLGVTGAVLALIPVSAVERVGYWVVNIVPNYRFVGLSAIVAFVFFVSLGSKFVDSLVKVWRKVTRAAQDRVLRWALRRQADLLRAVPSSHALGVPVLCTRFGLDEPTRWLRFQELITSPGAWITGQSARILRVSSVALWLLFSLSLQVSVVQALLRVSEATIRLTRLVPAVVSAVLVGLALTALSTLVAGLIYAVLGNLMLRAHGWGFGREGLADALLVQTKVRNAPPDLPSITVETHNPLPVLLRAGVWNTIIALVRYRQTFHSYIYEHPQSLQGIGRWLSRLA